MRHPSTLLALAVLILTLPACDSGAPTPVETAPFISVRPNASATPAQIAQRITADPEFKSLVQDAMSGAFTKNAEDSREAFVRKITSPEHLEAIRRLLARHGVTDQNRLAVGLATSGLMTSRAAAKVNVCEDVMQAGTANVYASYMFDTVTCGSMEPVIGILCMQAAEYKAQTGYQYVYAQYWQCMGA